MTAPTPDRQKFSPAALEFIEAVAALQPKIAVFDCDGTLWEGDAGADFFYWEIEHGLVSREVARWALPRYEDYKAGKVDEETMCGEMVTMNAAIPESILEQAAEEFFATIVKHRIFPEMQQVARQLANSGCNVWAVSSTNAWVIRAAAERFAIPRDRVLAVSVEIENGLATDRLIQVPTDQGKAVVIRKYVPGQVDVCFGNTIHDAAMLEPARHPFAIAPTKELQVLAKENGWNVYWPEKD